MSPAERIDELRRSIRHHEECYYVLNAPEIADAEFEADFNSDIVVRFKASERGAAAVLNPRYIVKNTG